MLGASEPNKAAARVSRAAPNGQLAMIAPTLRLSQALAALKAYPGGLQAQRSN